MMRDPTRGGVAATLNEIADAAGVGVQIVESSVPVADDVRAACAFLGLDPLLVANEGRVVVFVRAEDADRALETMRAHPAGEQSVLIGRSSPITPSRRCEDWHRRLPRGGSTAGRATAAHLLTSAPALKEATRPFRQHRVPDECHAVDQGMRDDHRHHAAPSFEQPSEEQAITTLPMNPPKP